MNHKELSRACSHVLSGHMLIHQVNVPLTDLNILQLEHLGYFLFFCCCHFVQNYYTTLNISLHLRLFPHENFSQYFYCFSCLVPNCFTKGLYKNLSSKCVARDVYFLILGFSIGITQVSEKPVTSGLRCGFRASHFQASGKSDKPRLIFQWEYYYHSAKCAEV